MRGTLVSVRRAMFAAALFVVPAVAEAASDGSSTGFRGLASLRASVPHLADLDDGRIREVAVRWLADAAGSGLVRAEARRPLDHLSVVWERPATGPLPRRRRPAPSTDRLVVVARDAHGREVGWATLADPRIVRAESPGPDGMLRGEILYRAETFFLLTLPAAPDILAIELFDQIPTPTGDRLRPVGKCELDR